MSLPTELLLHIIACVPSTDTPTLLSLALCSTRLYHITSPFLFRSPTLPTFAHVLHLCRHIARNADVAQHIHALDITLHHPSEIRLAFTNILRTPAFLRLVFRSLAQMSHLRSLTFRHLTAGYRCSCSHNLARINIPLDKLALPRAIDTTLLLPSLPTLQEADMPDPEPSYALDVLPASALPELQTLRLIRNAIVYLVPGRPVTTLSILGIITPDELPIFVSPLGRSVGPLQRLSIRVFKVDTMFYDEIAACVPFIVDLVAYSEIEDHAKMLSHLKRDACIEAFRAFSHLQTLELHASSIGRVVTSVKALPLVHLLASTPSFFSLVLINEKERDRQEVETYFIDERRGNQATGYWVREVDVTQRKEFVAPHRRTDFL